MLSVREFQLRVANWLGESKKQLFSATFSPNPCETRPIILLQDYKDLDALEGPEGLAQTSYLLQSCRTACHQESCRFNAVRSDQARFSASRTDSILARALKSLVKPSGQNSGSVRYSIVFWQPLAC